MWFQLANNRHTSNQPLKNVEYKNLPFLFYEKNQFSLHLPCHICRNLVKPKEIMMLYCCLQLNSYRFCGKNMNFIFVRRHFLSHKIYYHFYNSVILDNRMWQNIIRQLMQFSQDIYCYLSTYRVMARCLPLMESNTFSAIIWVA